MTDEKTDAVQEASKTPEIKDPPKVSEDPKTQEDPPKVEPKTVTFTTEEHEEMLKKLAAGENYKKENEGYRKQRVGNLGTQQTEQQPEQQEQYTPEPAFDDGTKLTIKNAFQKDKTDIINQPEIKGFIETCTDEQYEKITNLISGTDGLYNDALAKGEFVAKPILEGRIKEMIEFVKGPDTQNVEKARAEGAVEAQKLEQADIGTVQSAKKSVAEGITEVDQLVEEQTGGHITAERAKQNRENKEAREAEFQPTIRSNEID